MREFSVSFTWMIFSISFSSSSKDLQAEVSLWKYFVVWNSLNFHQMVFSTVHIVELSTLLECLGDLILTVGGVFFPGVCKHHQHRFGGFLISEILISKNASYKSPVRPFSNLVGKWGGAFYAALSCSQQVSWVKIPWLIDMLVRSRGWSESKKYWLAFDDAMTVNFLSKSERRADIWYLYWCFFYNLG